MQYLEGKLSVKVTSFVRYISILCANKHFFSSFGTKNFPRIPFSVLENTPYYIRLNHPIHFHAKETITTSLSAIVSLSNEFLAH